MNGNLKMSVQVPLTDINSKLQQKLLNELTVHKIKQNFARGIQAPPEPPLVVYSISEDRKSINLPLHIYTQAFGVCPPCTTQQKCAFEFTATLRNLPGETRDQVVPMEIAMQQLDTWNTTTLDLFPSFGKTICGMYLASKLGYKTLIISNRSTLSTQWVKTVTSTTNARVWCVDNKVYRDEYGMCEVIICLVGSIHRIPPHILQQVGTLLMDEAHLLTTPSAIPAILSVHPIYIILETATPVRADGLHKMLHLIAGKHSVSKKLDEPFTVYKTNTFCYIPETHQANGSIDFTTLVKNTVENNERNNLIIKLINENRERKILVLTNRVSHVQILTEMIAAQGITVDNMCGSKNAYYDADILVGVDKKIGTGFDQGGVCINFDGKRFDMLIICCSFKQEAALEQSVGRVLRAANPIVYHLVDENAVYKRHWNCCKKWYKSKSKVEILEYNLI